MGYARSPFRYFESFLKVVVDLDEDDVQLFLKQYNLGFKTYELSQGLTQWKKNSESIYTMGDHEGTLNDEHDDISLKTKLVLTPFGGTFGTLKFNENRFLEVCWSLHHIRITNLLMQFMLNPRSVVRVWADQVGGGGLGTLHVLR